MLFVAPPLLVPRELVVAPIRPVHRELAVFDHVHIPCTRLSKPELIERTSRELIGGFCAGRAIFLQLLVEELAMRLRLLSLHESLSQNGGTVVAVRRGLLVPENSIISRTAVFVALERELPKGCFAARKGGASEVVLVKHLPCPRRLPSPGTCAVGAEDTRQKTLLPTRLANTDRRVALRDYALGQRADLAHALRCRIAKASGACTLTARRRVTHLRGVTRGRRVPVVRSMDDRQRPLIDPPARNHRTQAHRRQLVH